MNWSFSSLMIYEQCALRFKFAKIDKVPEPERPPDNPLERGNRIHNAMELFVKGEGEYASEAKSMVAFEPLFEHARVLYANGMASTEDDWLFDENWEVCTRKEVWLWSKLDLNVMDEANGVSIVVDYKSGKSQYKQYEHMQQLQLYAGITALRQPWVNDIHAELWYVDEGHINAVQYNRDDALKFIGLFERRADRIFKDKFFRPNANANTCRWCPYSPRGNGHCPVGV